MHISKYIYNIQILEIWVIVKYSTWHLDYPEKPCSTFRWLQKKTTPVIKRGVLEDPQFLDDLFWINCNNSKIQDQGHKRG